MAARRKRNGQIDEEIEETFPASDPPSFMGGEVLGAPKGRQTAARRSPAKSARTAKTSKRKTKARRPAKKKPAVKKKTRATKARTRR